MRFEEFKYRLLVAIVDIAERQPNDWVQPKDAADHAQLKYASGLVIDATQHLGNDDLLTVTYDQSDDGPDRGVYVRVTGDGWDMAQELRDKMQRARNTEGDVPASDRLVPINHNSIEYKKADEALNAVYEAVKTNNAYRSSDPDDYDQRLAELDSGRRLLRAARVRFDAAKALLLPTLKHLLQVISNKVVNKAIDVALKALAELFKGLPFE